MHAHLFLIHFPSLITYSKWRQQRQEKLKRKINQSATWAFYAFTNNQVIVAKYRRASSPLYAGKSIQLCIMMSWERLHCRASSPSPAHVKITTAGNRGNSLKPGWSCIFYAYAHTHTHTQRYPLQLFSLKKRSRKGFKKKQKQQTCKQANPERCLCTPMYGLLLQEFLRAVPFSSLRWGMNRRQPPSKWRDSRELWLLVCYLFTSPEWDPVPSELQPSSPASQAIPCTAPLS